MPFDSGGGTTETKTTSAPWAPQVPYLTKGFTKAATYLDSPPGQATNSYLQNARVGVYNLGNNPNSYLQSAGQGAQGFAGGGNMGTQADPYLSGVMGGQGGQGPGQQYLGGMASGNTGTSADPYFDATMNGGTGIQPAYQYLAATAQGDMLNANPYVDKMFNQAADRYRGQVNGNASAAGRYSSGAHQDVLQQGLGDLATNIYGQNYANERQNQLAATGQIQGSFDTEQARRMAAAGQLAGNQIAGHSQQLQAAGQLQQGFDTEQARQLAAGQSLQQGDLQGRQQQLQGIGMLPGIYGAQLQGQEAAMGAGKDIQNELQAQRTQRWNDLQSYVNTIAGNYGQATTQQNPYYTPSPLSQIVGGGLGLAGAAGGMGWNPFG